MLQRGVRATTEVRIDTISFVLSAVAIQRTLKLKRKIVTSKIRYETKEYLKYRPKKDYDFIRVSRSCQRKQL